jgi:hypothetical protein
MQQFRVRLDVVEAVAIAHRRAVATLPEHFILVSDGAADAILVTDDGGSEWPARIRLIREPEAVDGDTEVPSLLLAPQLVPAASNFAGTPLSVLDLAGRVTGTAGLGPMLLEQMAVVRLLGGRGAQISAFSRSEASYVAVCELGDLIATASASVCVGDLSCTVDAVAPELRLHAALDCSGTAAASLVEISGGTTLVSRSRHQSSQRLTWLAVHAMLCGDDADVLCQTALEEDLAEVRRVLPG